MNDNLQLKQYADPERFNARIRIHAKYGTNKTPWPIWLFSLYHFPEHARIIEFGCGNGLIWKVNSFRISHDWQIELTDFSSAMIESARSAIGPDWQNISFHVVDLSDYSSEARRYTNILANHMLYHIDDRSKALNAIYEALEPKGEFYASTVGLDNMLEMKKLVRGFTGNDNYALVQGNITDRFSLENGIAQLAAFFEDIRVVEYPDSLEITDTSDLVEYVLSCNNLVKDIQVLPEEQKDDFARYVDAKIKKDGKIHITKSSGTFITRKNE
jgi:2-polyprenyl-3-methyl-5-hydroxy-6-metoxy-1,4-benzoquinol methylase